MLSIMVTRGFSCEQYLCLPEFAVGVLLQRLQLLVLLLGFLQLVLHVCILTGTLLQLKKQNTGALLFLFFYLFYSFCFGVFFLP